MQPSIPSRVIDTMLKGVRATIAEDVIGVALIIFAVVRPLLSKERDGAWIAFEEGAWAFCLVVAYHIARAMVIAWKELSRLPQPREIESVIYTADNRKQHTLVQENAPAYFRVTLISIGLLSLGSLSIGGYLAHVFAATHQSNSSASIPNQDEVRALDAVFAGRDEIALREYFGFPEMLDINVAMNAARKAHFAKTREPDMDLTPFIGNRQLQLNSAYDAGGVQRTPGSFVVHLDINSVSLLVLSNDYSVHKADLLKYENSSQLPPSVTFAVRDFDRILQSDTDLMQNLLNDLMRKDPNYFLLINEHSSPQYFKVIYSIYWNRFNQLRPVADQIRDSLRKAEGTD